MALDDSIDLLDQLSREWPTVEDTMDADFLAFVGGVTIVEQFIAREFQRLAQAEFSANPGDLRVLFALRRAGPRATLRPIELLKRLLITSGAVTKQLDKLEERQLIRRVRGPGGKRGGLVELTEQGRIVAENAMAAVARLPVMRLAFDALGEVDRNALLESMHGLIRKIQNLADPPVS